MNKKGLDRGAYLAALCRTVPYSIVEAVLANPVEDAIPQRETFEGSVLFADLVGFTPLCEELARAGPSSMGRLTQALNAIFASLLEDAVFPYKGYVIQFGGDSLTAVFRGEGHEKNAAASALSAQELMREKLSKLLAAEGRELYLRVGLATGNVRLTVVGDAVQRGLALGGTTAHRAVILQRLASPGEIVVDADLARRLGADAALSPLPSGEAVLRGLATPQPRCPTVELDGRIDTDVDMKLALLEPFVAPPLAARLKTTPLGWRVDGELRDVVILFAEVEGLDLGDRPADGTFTVVRSFLSVFRKYDGIVTKVDLTERGHRVLVVFGLIMPAENDAERAMLAGLEACSRFKSLSATMPDTPLSIRVGAHVGRVYFGTFGSDYRHDITVVGDAVNTAARVAAAAGPFELLATDAVRSAAAAEFESSVRPALVAKGKAEPVGLHVVHAPSKKGARYVRMRKAQRFYAGRAEATSRLAARVERAWNGDGALVAISGAAGTGKSAHLAQVIDEWTRRGGIGILGHCRYSLRGAPLAPIVSMFESFLGLTSSDTHAARVAAIRRGFDGFGFEGAAEMLALLAPTRGADGTVESGIDFGDLHSHERIIGAVLRFFGARMQQEPLLYVLEDLHHADALTLELTMRASHLTRLARSLLVVTYRPDPVIASLARVVEEQILLGPLDAEGTSELIRHELRAENVDPRLLSFCLRRTAGNPGQIVDLVRFLRNQGLVSVRAGVAVTPGGEDFLDSVVPASMANVALARIDELGEVERRLLRTASAIGERFPTDLLERVATAELDASMLPAAISNLEGQRVIAADEANQGYLFRDELTRAVAYGTIPDARRRLVHQTIADALEALHAADPARAPAALAIHRERAGQFARAAEEYEKATLLAINAGLHEEAVSLVDRWEATVAALPEAERPSPRRVAKLALWKLIGLGRRANPRETVHQGRIVLQQHWAELDPAERLHAHRWLGEALSWTDRDAAREHLAQASAETSEESRLLRFDAALLVARTYEFTGDIGKATEWIDKAATLVRGEPYRDARVDLARARLIEADLPEARRLYGRVVAFARAQRHLPLDAAATSGLSWVELHSGNFAEAERGYREVVALYRALGVWSEVANASVNLGQTLLFAGRADDALPLLEGALSLAADSKNDVVTIEGRVHLGMARALTEDPRGGLELLLEGERQALEMGLREASIAAALHRLRLGRLAGDPAVVEAARADVLARAADIVTPLVRKNLDEPSG